MADDTNGKDDTDSEAQDEERQEESDAHSKETLKQAAVKEDFNSIKETGLLSNVDEARGYIEEFLDDEFLEDLIAVIQGTEKLTGKSWRVVVTSKGVDIKTVEGAAIMGKKKDE